MAVISFYPDTETPKGDETTYYCGCAAYARRDGQTEYQGIDLRGHIPIAAMVRWARQAGFLKWDTRDA